MFSICFIAAWLMLGMSLSAIGFMTGYKPATSIGAVLVLMTCIFGI